MKTDQSRERQIKRIIFFLTLLLLVPSIIYVQALFIEQYLSKNDIFLRETPFDSNYYHANILLYRKLSLQDEHLNNMTWGHLINSKKNFGLSIRDEGKNYELDDNKTRILVIGDSLTWGAGLAIRDRYSNILEYKLNAIETKRKFEVFNFGQSGAPATLYVDILERCADKLKPSFLVIGFCQNDPQPKSESYRIEKEKFDKKYGLFISMFKNGAAWLGFPYISDRLVLLLDKSMIFLGLYPTWEVGLGRVYDENSEEWKNFESALKKILEIAKKNGIKKSYLISLIQNSPQSSNYLTSLKWHHQAENLARQIGFSVVTVQEKLEEINPNPREVGVSPLDGHPSVLLNKIYGDALYQQIKADLNL